MNFLTATVEIEVDYSKLDAQLAKVKQKVMKSTDAMEKSYVKTTSVFTDAFKKAGGVALKAMADVGTKVGLLVFSFTRLGLTIKTALNITKYIIAFDLLSSAVGQTTLTMRHLWLGVRKLFGWIPKQFNELLVNIRKTRFETRKLNRELNKSYWIPSSVFGMLMHPVKTWKAMIAGAKEGAGAIDMVGNAFAKQVEKVEGINETLDDYHQKLRETKILLEDEGKTVESTADKYKRYEQTMKDARDARREAGQTMMMVLFGVPGTFTAVYDAAKWAFGGILDITTSVFHRIFNMSIWVKTGIIAAFVGMYYKITSAAMDAEDALSFEELGPTRTILQQMYDAFTGIAAVIGKPFLTSIRLVASTITEWLEKSRPLIRDWAETFANRLRTLQYGFIDWVKFLTTDFKGGVTVALRVVSELFKGFADALIILMDFAGRRAGKALVGAFRGVVTNLLPSLVEEMDKKLKWLGQKLMKSSEHAARQMQRLTGIPAGRPEFRDVRLGKRAPTEAESASAAILRVYRERAENIKTILEGMPTWGSTEVAAAEVAEKQIKKSALILEATGDAMARHRAKMLEEGGKLAEMELRLSVERINQMMEEDFFARFQKGIAQMKVDFITWGDIGQTVAETMKSSFADAFYAMTTEGRKWKDAMKSFARDVLIAIQKSLAARAAGMIMTGAVGPIMGWLGGVLGGGVAPTQATGINPTASPVGLQHGGKVLETGWAKVHKGETYSGVDGGSKPVVVNITKIGADFETDVDEFEQMDEHVVNIVVRDIVAGGKLATLTGAG